MLLINGKADGDLSVEAAQITYDNLKNDVYHGSSNLSFEIKDNLKHDVDVALKYIGTWLTKQTN